MAGGDARHLLEGGLKVAGRKAAIQGEDGTLQQGSRRRQHECRSGARNVLQGEVELAEATLRHGTVELLVAQAETSAEKALGAVKDAKIARLRLNAS